MDVPRIILYTLGAYLALGVVFAIWFALAGAARLDPVARAGTLGFRVLMLPGACALWPLLLRRTLRARSCAAGHEVGP